MITNVIKKVQKKSEREKVFFAGSISAVLSLLLFFIWGFSFVHSGSMTNIASGIAGISHVVGDTKLNTKPLQTFFDNVKDIQQKDNDKNTQKHKKQKNVRKTNIFLQSGQNDHSDGAQKYGDHPADVLY